jgi:shikimate kinase/3-dehydroquinate synthase
MTMKHIFLYGPPGSGKSSVGKALAERLRLPFVDLDHVIAGSAGQAIPQIMERQGESAFRAMETEALKRFGSQSPSVIALGGGTLLRAENRRFAEQSGQVVFLDADFAALTGRLREDQTRRPLLAGNLEEKLRALLEQRNEHYGSFAVRVSQSGQFIRDFQKTPEQIASEIQQKLNLLRVHSPDNQFYDVLVLPGGLDSLGATMRARELGDPVFIIADETVADLYAPRAVRSLQAAGYEPHVSTFPAGEPSKNISTVMRLWQDMLGGELDRHSMVVALGGGVTGDLAGFAASTFMRGLGWVGVPTTLLAMIDSSVGGKTGFDLPEGKNLVGSFHDPRLVLVDTNLLSTLPAREISAGMAEAVKHGIVGDPELFSMAGLGLDFCKQHMTELIGRAIAVKMGIVEEDPSEQNARAALNLGHTIGHALEVASGYSLLHGEAVAIGLVAETRLAEWLGIAGKDSAARLASILRGLDLPVSIPTEISRQSILRALHVDKKRASGRIRFTLPVRVGEVKVGVAVEDLDTALDVISQAQFSNVNPGAGYSHSTNRKRETELQ